MDILFRYTNEKINLLCVYEEDEIYLDDTSTNSVQRISIYELADMLQVEKYLVAINSTPNQYNPAPVLLLLVSDKLVELLQDTYSLHISNKMPTIELNFEHSDENYDTYEELQEMLIHEYNHYVGILSMDNQSYLNNPLEHSNTNIQTNEVKALSFTTKPKKDSEDVSQKEVRKLPVSLYDEIYNIFRVKSVKPNMSPNVSHFDKVCETVLATQQMDEILYKTFKMTCISEMIKMSLDYKLQSDSSKWSTINTIAKGSISKCCFDKMVDLFEVSDIKLNTKTGNIYKPFISYDTLFQDFINNIIVSSYYRYDESTIVKCLNNPDMHMHIESTDEDPNYMNYVLGTLVSLSEVIADLSEKFKAVKSSKPLGYNKLCSHFTSYMKYVNENLRKLNARFEHIDILGQEDIEDSSENKEYTSSILGNDLDNILIGWNIQCDKIYTDEAECYYIFEPSISKLERGLTPVSVMSQLFLPIMFSYISYTSAKLDEDKGIILQPEYDIKSMDEFLSTMYAYTLKLSIFIESAYYYRVRLNILKDYDKYVDSTLFCNVDKIMSIQHERGGIQALDTDVADYANRIFSNVINLVTEYPIVYKAHGEKHTYKSVYTTTSIRAFKTIDRRYVSFYDKHFKSSNDDTDNDLSFKLDARNKYCTNNDKIVMEVVLNTVLYTITAIANGVIPENQQDAIYNVFSEKFSIFIFSGELMQKFKAIKDDVIPNIHNITKVLKDTTSTKASYFMDNRHRKLVTTDINNYFPLSKSYQVSLVVFNHPVYEMLYKHLAYLIEYQQDMLGYSGEYYNILDPLEIDD